jgi:amino acid adenylation domain-containing protein/FkbH-like protein
MLLTICSKNNETDVDEAFRIRTEMPLRRSDVVSCRINWSPKSANLRDLAAELDLGLDSFIFIDDSPTECAEVQSSCPQVLTLQLPEKGEDIPAFLDHVWALDHWQTTADDRTRTAVYNQKLERERVQKQASNISEFVASLNLQIDITSIQPATLPRVSQLTQRTNQFNCTTIRRSEAEIQTLLNDGYECLTVDVSDRFGAYGLVGVVIYRASAEAIEVDSFLLSCRALGRGVEHRIIRHLGEVAGERGLGQVILPFHTTAKNTPARLFLDSIAGDYRSDTDTGFCLNLPAAYAADVSYRPTDAVVVVEETPKKAAAAPAAPAARFRDYERVAKLLRTPDQVLTELERLQPSTGIAGTDFEYADDTERRLAAIWSDLLGFERVGRDANFFQIGGHSLLGVRLLSRIYDDFPDAPITLTTLLAAPTIPQLAALLMPGASAATARDRIERRSADAPVALSIGQEGLWYVQQVESGNPFYSIPLALRLTGDLSLPALQAAVNAVIRRHDTLRTTIATGADGGVATIHEFVEQIVQRVDLRNEANPEQALQNALVAEAAKPFRLHEEAGIRTILFRTAEREHTLFVNINHVYADGWSMGVWRRDFASYYRAFVEGTPAALDELAVTYPDFAAWERNWINGKAASEQLAYWDRQLQGSQHALALPTDHPRPPRVTYLGSVENVSLSPALVQSLNELAGTTSATLFMTLLAGWYSLLYRYSGQEDILVGSPIANRTKPEVQGLIGLFMNMVVLRGDVSGQPTFRELLARVRDTTLAAYANQEYPFEKLVEQLKPDRDPSRTPFYQNILILQSAGTDEVTLPGVQVAWDDVHTGTAKTDLTLSLTPHAGGLRGSLEYNTDLFDTATIRRMLDHYEVLLRNAVANPDAAVSRLDLLTRSERRELIEGWNNTESQYPDRCVYELISEQAHATPDRVAVVFEGRTLTYGELNARANRLAHVLRKQGIGPDVLAGVLVERSPEMLISLLAVWKAGGAYVPLDPIYPQDRRDFMVEDSGLKILITDEYLQENAAAIEQESSDDPPVLSKPENLAYVIYTSGSTGKPKGVEIPQSAFTNFLWSFRTEPGMTADDTLLAITTISFDIAGLEMFLPLLTGARLVIASRETALQPDLLAQTIEEQSISVLQATPATWRLLLNAGWPGNSRLKVLCGGEALPPDLVAQMLPRCAELWNVYGPTETTVWSSVQLLKPEQERILIGKPIANTTTYVLDAALNLAPIGAIGELFIGGDGLARGYRNRPELTEEKFIPDPFRSNARIYRTGDLARWMPDGTLECLGRTDHQVKIRGFRIELGEIESVLKQQPGIRETVVAPRPDATGDQRLIAYVVMHDGQELDAGNLRAVLREQLPDYMVPSGFVALPALPLTANGKIDKKALPAPDEQMTAAATRDYIEPRTHIERQLAQIWAHTFGLEQVGALDNFFDLGGHSLLAVKLTGAINRTLGVNLPLNALFQYPTVEQLAGALNVEQKRVGLHSLYVIQASGSKPPIYWIPGGAALALFNLRHLITNLGPDQPVYGLGSDKPPSLNAIEDVVQRATQYLQLVRQNQPHGPYCLAGFCLGGLVAYEMAQQLLAAGEEVGFLGLVNTFLPNPYSRKDKLKVKVQRLIHQVQEHGDVLSFTRQKLKARREHRRLRNEIERGLEDVARNGFNDSMMGDWHVLLDATTQVLNRYTPSFYPGKVSLFISGDDEVASGIDPELDPRIMLRRYVQEHELIMLRGHHEGVLDMPYALDFAKRLSECLDNSNRSTRERLVCA